MVCSIFRFITERVSTMTHTNFLLLCAIIQIPNVLCNGYPDLVVGPRGNETGRYIYSSRKDADDMTSSKSRDVYKHCLYCDNDVAFVNTSMNKLHQEGKCSQKYANNSNIIDGISEYERTNKLYPFCKLGVVPGCGPPPNKSSILHCELGYSKVLYSVYFSCITAKDESGTLLSEYYCNEMLQWEFIKDHKKSNDTTRSPSMEKYTHKTGAIVNQGTNTVTAEEKPKTEMNFEETTVISRNTVENKDDGALHVVIVILACVLFLLALTCGGILVRYVCKRRRKRRFMSSPNPSSTKRSSLSAPFKRCPTENSGEEGPLRSFTSNLSIQADIEGGHAISTMDTLKHSGSPTVETMIRKSPLGQEKDPLLKVLSPDGTSNTGNTTFRSLSLNSIGCQTGLLRPIGESGQAPNTQHQTPGSNYFPPSSCPNNKTVEDNRFESQRQQPSGKDTKPRHGDPHSLEENSHNTEPKRVVSMGMGNDASFELAAADSGFIPGAADSSINRNFHLMKNLK